MGRTVEKRKLLEEISPTELFDITFADPSFAACIHEKREDFNVEIASWVDGDNESPRCISIHKCLRLLPTLRIPYFCISSFFFFLSFFFLFFFGWLLRDFYSQQDTHQFMTGFRPRYEVLREIHGRSRGHTVELDSCCGWMVVSRIPRSLSNNILRTRMIRFSAAIRGVPSIVTTILGERTDCVNKETQFDCPVEDGERWFCLFVLSATIHLRCPHFLSLLEFKHIVDSAFP